ncbi:hypothetical protein D9M72_559820 [compost metagenome]
MRALCRAAGSVDRGPYLLRGHAPRSRIKEAWQIECQWIAALRQRRDQVGSDQLRHGLNGNGGRRKHGCSGDRLAPILAPSQGGK